MLTYECYKTAADKRKAQRAGVKRGKPSGKANDYVVTFRENGVTPSGTIDAIGTVGHTLDTGLCGTGVGLGYLRLNCRRVGYKHLPDDWRRAFDRYLAD